MFLLFLSSIWACPRVSRLPCRRRTLLVPNRRIRVPLRSLRSVSTMDTGKFDGKLNRNDASCVQLRGLAGPRQGSSYWYVIVVLCADGMLMMHACVFV